MRKLIVLLLAAGSVCWYCKHRCPKLIVPTLQQKAQHLVIFLNEKGEDDGLCTATAIGPHAILTAEHCNKGDNPDTEITLDLSMEHRNLVSEFYDGRDHEIYLLDGPAFKNYLRPDELIEVAPVRADEKVFIYGDGLGSYPPRRVDGQVDNDSNAIDFSDVDQELQAVWYTMAVVPGDSGSAIYASDGRVVGLVTYGIDSTSRKSPSKRVVGFALGFSEKVITRAHTFSPSDLTDAEGIKF